ncbi:MAG: Clp protease N-terminal domain-containing protein [Pyrinomonadaceae bacterium]
MFEKYTEKARRVIFFARYEVTQLGATFIDTEHLLLGLLRENKALISRFLPESVSPDTLREQIEARVTVGEKLPTSSEVPLSDGAKQVLMYAAEEAKHLSHHHIGPEHLLLGLLRQEDSLTAEILRENGLRLSEIRLQIARPE